MKEIFKIEDTLSNKISYYHMLAFVAALPFDRFYSELVLASFFLHELIHITRQKLVTIRLPVMLPVLIYLLTLLATIYSAEKGRAFGEWEKQLAFLLLPLIFS